MSSLNETASLNILSYLNEGRLVQRSWSREQDGKHLGCLLHAAGGYNDVSECPAQLMPRWVAECTITMFDKLQAGDVPAIARRYASAIGKWDTVTPEAWDNILRRWLVRLIDQAVDAVPTSAKSENYWPAIDQACTDVKGALTSGDKDAARAAAVAAYAATDAAANNSLFNALLDEIEKEIAA